MVAVWQKWAVRVRGASIQVVTIWRKTRRRSLPRRCLAFSKVSFDDPLAARRSFSQLKWGYRRNSARLCRPTEASCIPHDLEAFGSRSRHPQPETRPYPTKPDGRYFVSPADSGSASLKRDVISLSLNSWMVAPLSNMPSVATAMSKPLALASVPQRELSVSAGQSGGRTGTRPQSQSREEHGVCSVVFCEWKRGKGRGNVARWGTRKRRATCSNLPSP